MPRLDLDVVLDEIAELRQVLSVLEAAGTRIPFAVEGKLHAIEEKLIEMRATLERKLAS